MRREEKYAFEAVEDITPPICPCCHERTLRNTDPLDHCDFGREGVFEMWQPVECDNCGIYGQIAYILDFEEGLCSLDFAKEKIAGTDDLMAHATACPKCGHIIASSYDGHAARFETLDIDIPTDEILVRWHCPECGGDGVIRLYPVEFQADADWMEADDGNEEEE